MKPILLFILTVFVCLPSAVGAQTGKPIVVKTEAPKLLAEDGGDFVAMDEKQFAETSRRYSSMSSFVGIKRKPAKLSAAALFGFNISIQGKNTSWILDRDEKNEYLLYTDLNGDGDLANEKPLSFKKTDGRQVIEIHRPLTETFNNQRRKYAYNVRIEALEELSIDKSQKRTVLKIQTQTMRRGSLKLNDRQIAFAMIGSGGNYDFDYNRLYFDLDGDGKFDTETPFSPEVYLVKEKFINFGDASYEFAVDHYGDSLTFKPLAKKMPARADLRIGSTAPDFSFKDLDGKARRLSDFRGKIVLIDVWGSWCAPCRREAPKLSAVYKNLKGKNFEIVSLNKNDDVKTIREFIGEHQMNWIHTQVEEDFLTLYRVNGYPTYFLLDKDGKIISNTLRAGEEMYKKIEELARL
jgi:thiol-disulfide isomerase/thioredoxin